MELIREIDARAEKRGDLVRWAVFKCGHCGAEKESRIYHGKKADSCGCVAGRHRHG